MGPNPQVFFQDLTWLFLFSRSYPQILSKFDVRMSYHQSNVFLQDLLNSSHRQFNLSNIHPGVSQRFMVVFLIVILNIWRPKKSSSLSVLLKIHGASLMTSSHNCFDCEDSFHPPGTFNELFPFLSYKGHLFKYFSFQPSAHILQILPVHHSNIL